MRAGEMDWMRSFMQVVGQEEERSLETSSVIRWNAESDLEVVQEGRGCRLLGDWEISS